MKKVRVAGEALQLISDEPIGRGGTWNRDDVITSPHRLLPGISADIEGQLSPDGHWVAYSLNESGRWEVYVASFPDSNLKYQVSDGGQQLR